MRCSTILTALSAAAVFAAPVEKRAYVTEVVVVVETVFTTVFPTSTPAAAAPPPPPLAALQSGGHGGHGKHTRHSRSSRPTVAPPAPTPTEPPVVVTPAPTPTPEPTNAPAPVEPTTSTEAQPTAPAQTGSPSVGNCPAYTAPTDFSTPPTSCGVSVLDTINKWRAAYKLTPLTWSEKIAEAAWNTLTSNRGGVTMVHPGLINGSGGEVITPGFWQIDGKATEGQSPFETALVAWLCEVGSDKQLQKSGFTGIDQCNIAHNVAGISGSADPKQPTGHHDIILGKYATVGCLYMQKEGLTTKDDSRWTGQWTCDFGF